MAITIGDLRRDFLDAAPDDITAKPDLQQQPGRAASLCRDDRRLRRQPFTLQRKRQRQRQRPGGGNCACRAQNGQA